MTWLIVFVGGGLGSLARYALSLYIYKPESLPWHTLCANALACLILGGLMVLQGRDDITETKYLLLATGFCGGFSTFSTFGAEVYRYLQAGETMHALTYVTLSLVVGIAAVWLGYYLSARLA